MLGIQTKEDRLAALADAKLRGGYYTPASIAQWLCAWCIRDKGDSVLEPSCGDGAFMQAAAERLSDLGANAGQVVGQLCGVELQHGEAARAALRIQAITGRKTGRCFYGGDFFEWHSQNQLDRFKCVVGNPPFIRYQSFPEPARSTAMKFIEGLGFRANRLTNIWVPFVVASTESLETGGRLAMVLPAELLQVSYAAQLRSYLVESFCSITVVTCNELFFDDAEQEVVLVLAEGKVERSTPGQACAVRVLQFDRISDVLSADCTAAWPKGSLKSIRHESEKWLKYFLTSAQIGLMRALRESGAIAQLGDHATVDVGVVTGNNDFFVVDKPTLDQWDIAEYSVRLGGRSSHLRGAIITSRDWKGLSTEGQRVHLLAVKREGNGSLSNAWHRYVEWGEKAGVNKGYKCSIRKPWYAVPAVWSPDCFIFRQIHDFPRAVVNRADATSTDTIHRMRCKVSASLLVSSLYTYLTAASAEIEGRSYGGGVLELEPTEAESLLVPKQLCQGLPVEEIDKCVREGGLAGVLAENDRLVLRRGLGLSERDCGMLKSAWEKMMNRRTSRRRRKA